MSTQSKLRRKPAAEKPAAPAHPRYRGVAYTVVEESGVWRWKVLPASPGLHAYEYAIPHGFRPSREGAEAAARAAIDMQLDS
jgi:hypothetical protein